MTKDKKYLVINSNTKEDSEIWIVPRDNAANEIIPKKLIPRVKGITSHIDHLRDFFVTITTSGSKSKSYKIAQLNDSAVAEQPDVKSGYEWQDLLPLQDPGLVIDEFDSFEDFFAIYCKKDGVPQVIV